MKTFVDFTLCGLNLTNIVVPYLGWHAGMPGLGRAAAASCPPEQFLTVCSSLAANYPSPAPTHTRKLSSAAPDMWGTALNNIHTLMLHGLPISCGGHYHCHCSHTVWPDQDDEYRGRSHIPLDVWLLCQCISAPNNFLMLSLAVHDHYAVSSLKLLLNNIQHNIHASLLR